MKDNSFSVAPPSLMSSDFDSRMQRAEESYSEWSSAMNFQVRLPNFKFSVFQIFSFQLCWCPFAVDRAV